jgi:hypothetical protein
MNTVEDAAEVSKSKVAISIFAVDVEAIITDSAGCVWELQIVDKSAE